jgi:hypothetical protein
MPEDTVSTPVPNRFDRMEVAGAFGDLGTLVPFVVAYISVLKMDPFGVLLTLGVAMVACGMVYRTPIPVQPMKAAGAIATTQAAQTIVITPAIVWGASLATGIVWLLLGLTGTARFVTRLINRPVVLGIILGLGFGFMIEGAKLMAQNWWIGGIALLGTSMLLTNRVIPAMFLLLLFGAAFGVLSDPTLLMALREVQTELRLPTFTLSVLTLKDFLIGAVVLALPQVPLTLGNAIIAITEENNRLFSHRPVNESKISTSTGLINLLSARHRTTQQDGCYKQHEAKYDDRTAGACTKLDMTGHAPGAMAHGHTAEARRCCDYSHPPFSRRNPVLDLSPTGSRRLRDTQGQGRAVRADGHGRAGDLERGHRLCGRCGGPLAQ